MTTTVSISGMTCAHCVRAVFTSLAGVAGIKRADVSIGRAVIEHDGIVGHWIAERFEGAHAGRGAAPATASAIANAVM